MTADGGHPAGQCRAVGKAQDNMRPRLSFLPAGSAVLPWKSELGSWAGDPWEPGTGKFSDA